MKLQNKTILIVAQETWGKMFISKQHYASELAKAGNEVYYMNGPDQENMLQPGEVQIHDSGVKNVYLIRHRLNYPYIIKFKAPKLHQFLMKSHLQKILKKIKTNVDIVWSFDLSNTVPLKCFPKDCFKIFMPVDEPLHPVAIQAAESADLILSVTNEILEKYKQYNVSKYFINHGVAEVFIKTAGTDRVFNKQIQVGLSGNMLRPEIDHYTILKIIQAHPQIIFNIWGTTDTKGSNLANIKFASAASLEFIQTLEKLPNVLLHGLLHPNDLAVALQKVDAFLICYDISKDQSRGTNYHKVLEYLATGKVLVANNITTYAAIQGLIEMTNKRENNEELPALFNHVVSNLEVYNSEERQKFRIEFAKKLTYKSQIARIESLLKTAVCKEGIVA